MSRIAGSAFGGAAPIAAPFVLAVASALLTASSTPAGEPPGWVDLNPGPGPSDRLAHVAVYDAARQRMLLMGGNDFTLRSDVWALSLDGVPAWQEILPAGDAPAGRWDHAAAWDEAGDRLLLFGGQGSLVELADTWELTFTGGPAWHPIEPQGAAPSARVSHSAIFDPVGRQLIVFGGHDGTRLVNDTWALSLADSPEWALLAPGDGGAPVERRDHVAVYDPVRRRMLVHGGYDGNGFRNDVWALPLEGEAIWEELLPEGALPEGAITHAGTWDPARDRLLIFGGSYHNEAWALPLAEPLEWVQLFPDGDPPAGRIDHTAVFDAARDRMVIFGGHTGLSLLGDTWALEWPPGATTVESPAGGAKLEEARVLHSACMPNPARGDCTVEFRLTSPARVSLRIADAAGRRVRDIDGGMMHEGSRALRWDGRLSSGESAPAGIYFYELTAGAARGRGRIVIAP